MWGKDLKGKNGEEDMAKWRRIHWNKRSQEGKLTLPWKWDGH